MSDWLDNTQKDEGNGKPKISIWKLLQENIKIFMKGLNAKRKIKKSTYEMYIKGLITKQTYQDIIKL